MSVNCQGGLTCFASWDLFCLLCMMIMPRAGRPKNLRDGANSLRMTLLKKLESDDIEVNRSQISTLLFLQGKLLTRREEGKWPRALRE